MKIIDVTLTLRPDMPAWPGEPGPKLEPHSRIAAGRSANVSILTLGDHTGTHVDPPVHMLEGSSGADRLPLAAMVGPCRVLRFDGAGHIGADWLERQSLPPSATRLLFRTRNSDRWRRGETAFDKEFCALDETAGGWLAARDVVLVGIDYLSIEPFGSSPKGHPVHKALLGKGAVIVEGLDLHEVEPDEYELACLPLKILDGDGAPARVVLIRR
jgi:arylformamidase